MGVNGHVLMADVLLLLAPGPLRFPAYSVPTTLSHLTSEEANTKNCEVAGQGCHDMEMETILLPTQPSPSPDDSSQQPKSLQEAPACRV